MFSFGSLKSARLDDIPRGTLVLRRESGRPLWGVVAQSPHNPAMSGMLELPRNPGAADDNFVFTFPTDYLLHTGQKPEFLWSGAPATITEFREPTPQGSHIIILKTGQAVSGYSELTRRREYGYWDITSFEVRTGSDQGGSYFFPNFSVGWRGINGQPHTLADIAPRTAAPVA